MISARNTLFSLSGTWLAYIFVQRLHKNCDDIFYWSGGHDPFSHHHRQRGGCPHSVFLKAARTPALQSAHWAHLASWLTQRSVAPQQVRKSEEIST